MDPQILLLGATGVTGRLVLQEALARGLTVTALVRKANANIPDHKNLTVVEGDPCNPVDVGKALSQTKTSPHLVIVSTLGQTRASRNPFSTPTSPPRLMETSVKAVFDAVETAAMSSRVQKLVVMSMFGVGDSFANLNFLMRPIMTHTNMARTFEDQSLVDAAVKAGSLPFVLARPAMLTEAEQAAPVKVYPSSGTGVGFMPKISAKSVAGFLLDAAVKCDWDGTTPVITN